MVEQNAVFKALVKVIQREDEAASGAGMTNRFQPRDCVQTRLQRVCWDSRYVLGVAWPLLCTSFFRARRGAFEARMAKGWCMMMIAFIITLGKIM